MKRTRKESTKAGKEGRRTAKATKTGMKAGEKNRTQRNAKRTPTEKTPAAVLLRTEMAWKEPPKKQEPQPIAPKKIKKATTWDFNGGQITLTDTVGVHLRTERDELKTGDLVRVKVEGTDKLFELVVKHIIAKKAGGFTVMAFVQKGTGAGFAAHRLETATVSW